MTKLHIKAPAVLILLGFTFATHSADASEFYPLSQSSLTMTLFFSFFLAVLVFYLTTRIWKKPSTPLSKIGLFYALTMTIFALGYWAVPFAMKTIGESGPAGRTMTLTQEEKHSLALRDAIMRGEIDVFRTLIRENKSEYNRSVLKGTYCDAPCKAVNLYELIALATEDGIKEKMISFLKVRKVIDSNDALLLVETGVAIGSVREASILRYNLDSIPRKRHRSLVKAIYSLGDHELAEIVARKGVRSGDVLNHSAYVGQQSSDGWESPLMNAVMQGDMSAIIRYAKTQPHLVNAQDVAGNSPLMIASFTGDVQAFEYLTNKGADYFTKTKNGLTAEDIARSKKHNQIANDLEAMKKKGIVQIQNGLYELNYDVGIADGAYGPQTRKAILSYQKRNNFPQDGNPSVRLEERMRNLRPMGPWGALAYNWNGAYSSINEQSTRRTAEEKVMASCRKIEKDCDIKTVISSSCISFAKGSRGSGGIAYGKTRREAEKESISVCSRGSSRVACKVRTSFCADGRE